MIQQSARRALVVHRDRLIALAIICFLPTFARSAGAAEQTPTGNRLLAENVARNAMLLLDAEPLTAHVIDTAVALIKRATEINPDDPALWELLLDAARLVDDRELHRLAVDNIVRLEPSNQPAQLLRLSNVIDRRQTIEERVAAYELLLEPSNIDKVTRPIASRLAYDLALLHRRQGNITAFSERLQQAVDLDPSNRSAAAMATGFFRSNVKDAFAEAELLSMLLVTDPTNVNSIIVLAQLLLENGAYQGAFRLYRLVEIAYRREGAIPPGNLLADITIAQWASGRSRDAIDSISAFQNAANALHQRRLQAEDPNLSVLEAAREQAPISPALSTTRAAIHNQIESVEADATLNKALADYAQVISSLEAEQTPEVDRIARLKLERAWLAVWLGSDAARAQQLFDEARSYKQIKPESEQRFEGWLAMRRGDLEMAKQLLGPLKDSDDTALLGYAMVMFESGATREAAEALLTIANHQPGTVIGVWSARQLLDLLGQPVPLSDHARKMEELIASIPKSFDRAFDDASYGVSLRVAPAKLNFSAFEPVIVNITLRNRSQFPLGISRNGPLRDQVLLIPTISIAGIANPPELQPIVVNIGDRLGLAPHEEMTVPVNLRLYRLGEVLDGLPLPGATLRVRAVSNFLASPVGAFHPALLGSDVETQRFRVDGVRVDTEWLSSALTAILQPASNSDIKTMVLLARIANSSQFDDRSEEREAIINGLKDAYPKVDVASQAWFTAMLPNQGPVAQLVESIRDDEHPWVRTAYLLKHITGPDDPIIAASLESDDPVVRQVASLVQTIMANASRAAQQPQKPQQ